MDSGGQCLFRYTLGRFSTPQQQLPFVFPHPTLRLLIIYRSEATVAYESQAVEDLLLNRKMHLMGLGEFRSHEDRWLVGTHFKYTTWRVRSCYPHLLVGK